MKLPRGAWPVVIARLVDAFIEGAGQHGVHGRVAVHEERKGDESYYVITVRVPAGETVASRTTAPKQ